MTDLEYKDYQGSVHYSKQDGVFHGKVMFIRALVSYEGIDMINLEKSFREAVDDYLELCKDTGKPEVPFRDPST